MEGKVLSRRVAWIAVALSLLSAGVGHVYCGRVAKALPLYFAWLLVPACGILAAILPPSPMGLTLLLVPSFAVVVVYVYAAVDAWLLAHQINASYSPRDYNRASVYWLMIVAQLVISISLIAGVRRFAYEAFLVPVNSMSPTILAGDRILARKLFSPDSFPQRGDLVVYRNPTQTGGRRFIGRVVAVAGDAIKIVDDQLLVNGKELDRDPVPAESLSALGDQIKGRVSQEKNAGHRYLVRYDGIPNDAEVRQDFEATVQERHVFILGDNRDGSRDSRHFGAIHAGDIEGYVDYVYWPAVTWSRLGLANQLR